MIITDTTQDDIRMNRTEAAKYLGVSVSFLALDAVTKRHAVPFYKMGRRAVYSRFMLDKWMASRVVNAPATTV